MKCDLNFCFKEINDASKFVNARTHKCILYRKETLIGLLIECERYFRSSEILSFICCDFMFCGREFFVTNLKSWLMTKWVTQPEQKATKQNEYNKTKTTSTAEQWNQRTLLKIKWNEKKTIKFNTMNNSLIQWRQKAATKKNVKWK